METLNWTGLYKESWRGEIVPAAFAHPAKYSRALIRRIYAYALEQNYLAPGDAVLDPFGGVGLGALDALAQGLNWTGCELEQKFCDVGQGFDCAGFTREQWRRYAHRAARINYQKDRAGAWRFRFCPDCLEAMRPPEDKTETALTSRRVLSPKERQAMRVAPDRHIPARSPHRYHGNIETWERRYRGWFAGTARIVQGDSRRLLDVLAANGYTAAISSPPYTDSDNRGHVDATTNGYRPNGQRRGGAINRADYGSTSGQLGAMREGDYAAAVSSPPFLYTKGGNKPIDSMDAGLMARHSATGQDAYGSSPGQLSALDEGSFAAAVSSPPYAAGCAHTGGTDLHPEHLEGGAYHGVGYSAAVSSPPYAAARIGEACGAANVNRGENYGSTDGQLGTLAEGSFAAAVSSPPYSESLTYQQPGAGGEGNELMRAGYSVQEIAEMRKNGDPRILETRREAGYSRSTDNLGNAAGETFWSAARLIVAQTYAALKPGGYAFWVCKDFVRERQIVPFCDQWRQLCESVGFETIAVARAWQVEDHGTQLASDGNHKRLTKSRKSFFRRLHESKYPETAIDYEQVLIMKKAGANEPG